MRYTKSKVQPLLEEHLTGAAYKPVVEKAGDSKRSDPRRASDGMAEMADVQKAWRHSGLTPPERYALYWHLIGYPVAQIGDQLRSEGWPVSATRLIDGAYDALLRYLNKEEQ